MSLPGQVQHWLKPQGIPDVPVNEHEAFAGARYRIGFAKAPRAVEVGDILIVYRIGISAVLYAGEAVKPWRQATADEIRQEPWRERWRWVVEVQNLSPEFGREWARHRLKPFTLAREYTNLNPADLQRLGTINFGNDKKALSAPFARYILTRMDSALASTQSVPH